MDAPHVRADFVSHELLIMTMNLFLMKLGGQVKFGLKDLEDISKNYERSRFVYEPSEESLTVTLMTRPDEFPPPELPRKA